MEKKKRVYISGPISLCYDIFEKREQFAEIEKRLRAKDIDNVEVPFNFTTEGKFHAHERENALDLVMAPTKKDGWVNLYEDSNCAIICKFHNTKEDALLLRCEDYIATTKIELEE